MNLYKYIAIREDWPKPGISFKDITPLLQDADAFKESVKEMAKPFKDEHIDKVICADARGFIFGAAVSLELKAGLIIARKPNKLPYVEYSNSYSLEYGENTLEIAPNAVKKGEKVLVVDDLLATGGSSEALTILTKQAGGIVVGYSFLIELTGLKAREIALDSLPTYSVLKYEF